MSRYLGPKIKKIRSLGELPGFTRKSVPSNAKVNAFRKKTSSFGIRLEEKQKIRFNYGIGEKQLLNYMKSARNCKGPTGEILLQMLEMRLDNTVFRMGFASTIPAARQLIRHGHICIKNNIISVPSYNCKPGDIISVRDNMKSLELVKKSFANPTVLQIPSHIELDKNAMTGKLKGVVERAWVGVNLKELLVVEYYSRKI
uniref:Small ribosomal subunit protein uS4c n=2 Tax=Pavlovaceae TaxID=418969 RepID=M1KFQ6_DIALT|nr:ribosomal protein S4 [Diacronema lutheri]YP_009863767.1 ribosomal protein S4 [Pavlova sp. NIVA-4/92]AGE93745.1 ribosomal protein S4 [Diacronema lutheri]QKE31098.1 ribosomal protein S4 [Pavlova sp. NIVA-4/92]|mmetsp:Transcript_5311/g.16683  ORF Transcript_5311/g.16683 Transcript_5311/m.16683 type:complete len:200 (+) Transcript_5311:116-715(+)